MEEGTIGLEIHTYLNTSEKLFCRCAAKREKGLTANSYICEICTGQPGAKPMAPNRSAVEKAVKIGLMLGCKINSKMAWQRKHYSWPDLPKGYQNTLSGPYAVPVGSGGKFFGIGIWEMHLEEDPAAWDPESGRVDYNRSGLPLVEIVTAPDFSTAEEVGDWLRKLLHHLSYLKVVEKDAGIKVDVNVNIPGKSERVELKNVNSVENIVKAIEFELGRQGVEGGREKETRRWDAIKGKSVVMRQKEGAADYRFIDDPDLQDIVLNASFVNELRTRLPETPEVKLEKLVKKHKIGKKHAEVLAKNLDVVEFFEDLIRMGVDAGFALPWVSGELLRHLKYNKTTLDQIEISAEHFADLLGLVKSGKITETQGKKILDKFYPKSFSVKDMKVGGKISDSGELEKVVKEVIASEGEAVEKYRSGDKKVLNYLIGKVMGKTKGRADFRVVREIFEKLLM